LLAIINNKFKKKKSWTKSDDPINFYPSPVPRLFVIFVEPKMSLRGPFQILKFGTKSSGFELFSGKMDTSKNIWKKNSKNRITLLHFLFKFNH
jgi:hypothetical protein